ncbi:hypothetical protein, partial [Sphingobacterium spiritivorum]
SSLQEIYLFEKTKAASAGASGAVALIIGGKYNGSNTETYYKVEFLSNTTTTPEPIDVLRNHHYIFNIVDISGEGYPTQQDALNAMPSNIQTYMVSLEGANRKITYFDEQYFLSLNNKDVVFVSNIQASVNINIQTNAPGGWKLTREGDWFTADKQIIKIPNGFGGYTYVEMLVIKPTINTTGSARQGKVTLYAGKIKVDIDVKQESN